MIYEFTPKNDIIFNETPKNIDEYVIILDK